jgi:hypothetical protein
MLMGLDGMAREGGSFYRSRRVMRLRQVSPLSREFLDKYLGSTLF